MEKRQPKDELKLDLRELDEGWGGEETPTAKHIPLQSGFFSMGPKEIDALSRLDEEEVTLSVDLGDYLRLMESPYVEIAQAVRARYRAFVARAFAGDYDEKEREAIYAEARLLREKLRSLKSKISGR